MTKRKDPTRSKTHPFHGMSAADRFMEYVQPEPNSGCWLWLGTVSAGRPGQAYGKFYLSPYRDILAHRASFLLFRAEEIPSGKIVTHDCDTKLCVNPDHLRISTHSENISEAWERGTGKATRAARVAARMGG